MLLLMRFVIFSSSSHLYGECRANKLLHRANYEMLACIYINNNELLWWWLRAKKQNHIESNDERHWENISIFMPCSTNHPCAEIGLCWISCDNTCQTEYWNDWAFERCCLIAWEMCRMLKMMRSQFVICRELVWIR